MPPVLIGAALIAGGIIAGSTAFVVLGAMVLLGSLLKPKFPKPVDQGIRLQKTLDPECFRKIVLGNTAGGNDERYWEVYGSGNNGYDEVIAVATHKITSFGNFYAEGDLVSFTGSNATGTFAGALSKDGVLQGVTATTVSGGVGAGGLWTSAASFTGCAYYRLKWTYSQEKLPNGIPNRTVQVVEGAPVYDPRRDSTNGGSGTHRYTDQTTWAYSTLDSNSKPIGRNNALQMLWYLLGWRIASPQTGELILVAGRGVDPTDIDFASFISAANTCESEGYYTDCMLSTGDSHTVNENAIAMGAGAVLLDSGGMWSYRPATNDTANIAVALTEDDIISGITWNPKASISEQYNQVGGQFIDPSTPALYQAMPYPPIKDSSYLSQDGGFPKRMTMDFPNVQDSDLAQKLARIALNKSRLSGQFKATFNYKMLKANNYDCVTLTFSPLGWTNRLFRVMSMAIDPIGGIECLLQEESASVYTGGTVTTYVPPGDGNEYDVRQTVAIASLTVTAVGLTGADGTVVDALQVSWATVPGIVEFIEIQYKKHTDTDWIPCPQVRYDVTTFLIVPVQPSTNYDVRARTVTINGVPGAWTTATQTSGGNTTIGSNQITIGAVSIGGTAYTSGSNAPSQSNTTQTLTAQTITITTHGGFVTISGGFFLCMSHTKNSSIATPKNWGTAWVKEDGTKLIDVKLGPGSMFVNSIGDVYYAFAQIVGLVTNSSPAAGSHTYTMGVDLLGGDASVLTGSWANDLNNRCLTVQEMQR